MDKQFEVISITKQDENTDRITLREVEDEEAMRTPTDTLRWDVPVGAYAMRQIVLVGPIA